MHQFAGFVASKATMNVYAIRSKMCKMQKKCKKNFLAILGTCFTWFGSSCWVLFGEAVYMVAADHRMPHDYFVPPGAVYKQQTLQNPDKSLSHAPNGPNTYMSNKN